MKIELIGKKIADVRPMNQAELQSNMWDASVMNPPPTVIVLEDGTKFYPSCDGEGNSQGVMFGEKGDTQFSI